MLAMTPALTSFGFEHLEQPETVSAADKQESALEQHEQGVRLLQHAKTEAFQDKQILMTAYRHFASAMTKDPQNPQYPTSMAYLLSLIGCQKRALNYLGKALGLDAAFQPALNLKANLNKLNNPSEVSAQLTRWNHLKAQPWPQNEDQFDDLYEEVEDFITRELHYMMQLEVPAQASLDTKLSQQQWAMHSQLYQLENLVEKKLQVLEIDVDVMGLRDLLEPIRRLKRRYEQVLVQNDAYADIQEQIEQARAQCRQISKNPAGFQDKQTLSQSVESLLDECDHVADQLDLMSERYSITLLEPMYEQMVADIERLQEQIEDDDA